MIDPAGRTTAWEYDAYGSLLVKTLPDGSAVRTEFDLDHRPVCMTLIGGRQWGYEWDTFGNLLAQIDPSGAISRYTYDEYGQLVEHTGPRGASTRFDYHPDGNLAAQIDALGHRTQYRYDARGYLVEAIDALGQQSQYEYDRNGNLTRAIEPGGREIHCAYDADGNLSRHRDPMGHVTQMEYSALGQVSRRLAPDGTTVEYRYDTEEQLIGVVNERSEHTRSNAMRWGGSSWRRTTGGKRDAIGMARRVNCFVALILWGRQSNTDTIGWGASFRSACLIRSRMRLFRSTALHTIGTGTWCSRRIRPVASSSVTMQRAA